MIFWVGQVKNGDSLLVRETLKYAYLMNKLLNWADFLNADSDAKIFKFLNPTIWLLNAGGLLYMYFLYFS